MPIFEIEQYEVCTSKVRVEAQDKTEAIKKFFDNDCDPVDDSTEFIEMDETRGMSKEVADELEINTTDIAHAEDWGVPTIRGIEVV